MTSDGVAVRVENDGPVRTVVLSRPEARNAVDRPTAEALFAAFEEFDADDSAAVAVLWGEGGTFCAGADLKALGTERQNRLEPPGEGGAPGPMGPTRMRLGKPVIAAVSGFAVAGGLELALWCDMRVVARDAVFGVFCRRWGVPLIDGGTVRLPRLVGAGRAMDMILTGRSVGAEEALAIGLADRVVGVGEERAAAEELAAELALLPQGCMRGDRLAMREGLGLDDSAALAGEWERGMASLGDGSALSGAARFAAGAGRGGAPAS